MNEMPISATLTLEEILDLSKEIMIKILEIPIWYQIYYQIAKINQDWYHFMISTVVSDLT